MARDRIDWKPLTEDTWTDFEALFGAKGACGGCWCMTPRLTRSEYEKHKGPGNKRKMRALVRKGHVPGILLYDGAQPVAWCAIEPRERLSSLSRSRILAPVDDRPVWSIVCLFIAKDARGQGWSKRAIEAACRHARACGAEWVEAYPVQPKNAHMPAVFAYTGIASAYLACGFEEVARRSPTRPIVRRRLR